MAVLLGSSTGPLLAVDMSQAWADAPRRTKSLYRYQAAVRAYLSVIAYGDAGDRLLTGTIAEAAQTMSDPADLINRAIEALHAAATDLPAFSTLDRLVNRLRAEAHARSTIVLTLPRGRPFQGRGAPHRTLHVVDYRHVIHALRRKPGALLNLVYCDQLFPRGAYRRTWDRLVAAEPARTACRVMVGLLALAHERGCEADLAAELDRLIEADAMPDPAALERRFAPVPGRMPDVTVTLPSPALYDALLIADAMPDAQAAGVAS